MLNLKYINKSKDQLSLKVVASHRFLTSINNNIANIKSSSDSIQEKEEKMYKVILKDAITILARFAENPDEEDKIRRAAKKFTQALELRKIYAEPYFYLAFIYNYLGQNEISIRYLQVARFINPELSGIRELKGFNNRPTKTEPSRAIQPQKPVPKTQPGVLFKPDTPVLRRFPKY